MPQDQTFSINGQEITISATGSNYNIPPGLSKEMTDEIKKQLSRMSFELSHSATVYSLLVWSFAFSFTRAALWQLIIYPTPQKRC
jgi:hypothetical protein